MDNDNWKIFDDLTLRILDSEENKIFKVNEGDEVDNSGCNHKDTTRITEYKVCCIECGLMIFEPVIPYAYTKQINNKIKKKKVKI